MTAQIKPCPFCGGQPGVMMNQAKNHRIITICCKCGVRGDAFVAPHDNDSNLTEAIAAWNTRPAVADPSVVGEAIEALRFYADPEAWRHPPVKTSEGLLGIEYENQAYKMQVDRGRMARAILAKLEGGAA